MHRHFLAVALLVGLAACSGSDDSAPATDPVGTTPQEPVNSDTAATAPAATDPEPEPTTTPAPTAPAPTEASTEAADDDVLGAELVGRWAHYDVVAYQDETLKTLIISYGFNDLTEVDGQIIDAAEFCFSEQRTDQPIQTSLSDEATQAIKPPTTPIEVDTVDGVLRVRRPATPTPVGIRLDDPANESLPTDPADPRIVDDDGDGKPGLTVTIEIGDELTGELYIARREIFAYEAFLTEPDLIEGTVIDDSEQLVIGAIDPVFAIASEWEQYPDPEKNPLILRRVEDDWDCERLAAERDALFPPTPVVDF